MSILDLIRGMLFGYGLKALQIAATLLVVPFVLSRLGIDRYGHIFAIVSTMGVLSLASDGLKLSFARSISQSISDGPASTSKYIGSGLKAMMLLGFVVAALMFGFRRPILGVLGVPIESEYAISIALAAGVVAVENGLFAFHAYLTARGRLDLLNTLAAIEVLVRNASFVAYFVQFPPSAAAYLAIFLAWSTLRYLVMAVYAIRTWPADFRGIRHGRVADSWAAVSYSIPLTLDSLQHYVFQRFSIPLVNRFIGPTEAGLLALAINTISENLAQILFTVARPLLVPVAARLDLSTMTSRTRHLLLKVDAMFALCVAAAMVPLVAVMPTVVAVWLGSDYQALVLPAQILVAGTTINVSFNVRRSLLIGQGRGGMIVRVSSILCIFAIAALAWALIGVRQWVMVAAVIASFSAVSSALSVGSVFERVLLTPEAKSERGTLRRTLAWSIGLTGALFASQFAPDRLSPSVLVPGLGSVLLVLLVAHLLVIRASDLIATVRVLSSGARKSLFNDP